MTTRYGCPGLRVLQFLVPGVREIPRCGQNLTERADFQTLAAMYKIVGADQKEYGPVTEDQLRQWIAEGRANAQTIGRLGDGPWKPLGTFPEFASAFGAVPPPSSSASPPSAGPPPPALREAALAGRPVPTSGMAIAGLVCSVLGLFCCGPLFSTVGLILSVLALSQINQNPSQYAGKGIAVAGIVLALVGYAIFALLLLTGIFRRAFRRFPRFIRA
jgi:Domain of unknown function (DUF4190)/GYF domain 2